MKLCITIIVAFMLGGCSIIGERQLTKTPVMHYEPVSHDIHYPQNAVILSKAEEQKLHAFLTSTAANPGGNIALRVAPTAQTSAMKERLTDVNSRLRQLGYHDVIVVEDETIAHHRIRVTSSTVTATAPDCPDWSYAHMENYRNSVLSNHGCATSTNLVKMVADPNDLIAGKGDPGADAERGSGVIKVYREPPIGIPSVHSMSQTGGM